MVFFFEAAMPFEFQSPEAAKLRFFLGSVPAGPVNIMEASRQAEALRLLGMENQTGK